MNTLQPQNLSEALELYNDLYALTSQTQNFPYAEECLLSALYRQATIGDCIGSRPSRKECFERHKFDVWHELKGMPQEDAETLFIQELTRVNQELTQTLETSVA